MLAGNVQAILYHNRVFGRGWLVPSSTTSPCETNQRGSSPVLRCTVRDTGLSSGELRKICVSPSPGMLPSEWKADEIPRTTGGASALAASDKMARTVRAASGDQGTWASGATSRTKAGPAGMAKINDSDFVNFWTFPRESTGRSTRYWMRLETPSAAFISAITSAVTSWRSKPGRAPAAISLDKRFADLIFTWAVMGAASARSAKSAYW